MPSRILRLWNPNLGAWEEVGDSRLSTHLAAADPHPQYLTAAEGTGQFLPLTGGTLTGALLLHGATSTTNVLQAKLAADTQPRFRSDAAGKLEWGLGGSTAPDAALARGGGGLTLTGDFLPDGTNTRRLGTPSAYWSFAYVTSLRTSDGGSLGVGASGTANTGAIRLRNAANGAIGWRTAANTADRSLTLDASDRFAFDADVLVNEATPTVSLKQAADTEPRSRLTDTALSFGPGGGTAPDTTLSRTGAQQVAMNSTLTLTPAAGQASVVYQIRGGSGALYLTEGLGSFNNPRLYAAGGLELDAGLNAVLPARDNALSSGLGTHRWTAVYAVNGTIQTSSREFKEGITPLDPAAALEAVRSTPAVTFTYTAPERPPAYYDLPDDPVEAQRVLEQRARTAPLEEAARHQAGFIAEDCDPLFLTGEGQTNPSNTCGVLLAALQALDARLTQLEGA